MSKNDSTEKKFNSELDERVKWLKKRHPLTPSVRKKLKALGRYIQERRKEYKKAWPLGFDCYELFLDKNPSYMYKLRKATFRELKKRGQNVRYGLYKEYKDKDYRLFIDDLGDLPEDFFRTELVKCTNKENMLEMNMPEFIKKFNKVPESTWNSLSYYINKKYKITDSFEEKGSHILSGSLSIDFALIDRLNTAFKELSEKQREAIKLIYGKKPYSITEAAMHLGIKKQSVSERHKIALEKLDKILSE